MSCGRAHTLVVTRIVRRSGRDLARTASMRAQGRLEEGEDPLGGVPASAGPRPITGAGIGPHGQLRADTRTAQAEEESVLRAGGPRQWGTNQVSAFLRVWCEWCVWGCAATSPDPSLSFLPPCRITAAARCMPRARAWPSAPRSSPSSEWRPCSRTL